MKNFLLGSVVTLVLCALAWWFVLRSSTAPLIDVTSSAATSSASAAIGEPSKVSDTQMQYQSAQYHFSFIYPKTLAQVSDTPESDGGHTVVFDDGKDSSINQSFQIYVVPYDGITITKERFLSDEPSGVIKERQDVLIDGVRATLFTGYNNDIGDTRELWFIHGGYLYEVVTYKRLDTWLAGIMQTWKFI